MAKKVMITCAVTGSIHTPSMSPYLPVTPQEIADAAIGAAEAGAARSSLLSSICDEQHHVGAATLLLRRSNRAQLQQPRDH